MFFRLTTRVGRVMYSFIVVNKSCPPAMGRAASSASPPAGASFSRLTASSMFVGLTHSNAFMRSSFRRPRAPSESCRA